MPTSRLHFTVGSLREQRQDKKESKQHDRLRAFVSSLVDAEYPPPVWINGGYDLVVAVTFARVSSDPVVIIGFFVGEDLIFY